MEAQKWDEKVRGKGGWGCARPFLDFFLSMTITDFTIG